MNNRLYRHPTDKVIGGVGAGMAAWLNIDPALVRIAWVLLAIFTSGALVIVYLVMLFVVPLAPPGWMPPNGRPFAGGGPGAAPGQGTAGWGPAGQPGQPGQAGQPGQPGAAPGGWQPQPGQPWSPPSMDTGNAGIVAGAGLVILGVWFLVNQYVDIDIDWSLLWPVVIMLGGIALIVVAARRNRTGR